MKILNSRWKFKKPSKKNILIFDGFYNPFKKKFKKNSFNLFYARLEELNFYILIKCLKKKSLNFQTYIKTYIETTKPKIIISGLDNSLKFLKLSEITNVPLISVQNGYRTKVGDLSSNIIESKKQGYKFFVNEMFVYNKKISKDYSKFIDGKKTIIGSYKNNNSKIKKIKFSKKKGMLFISCFKPKKDGSMIDNISYEEFYKKDHLVAERLSVLSKKNKIDFAILARQKTRYGLLQEYNYYKKNIKSNFYFIENYHNRNYFKYMDSYKYVATIDSTLPIENLSRGGRSIFIFSRPLKKLLKTRRYGFNEGLPKKGFYWTDTVNKKEIDRLFYNLILKDKKFWIKCRRINNKYVMKFDLDNKIFEKKIRRYLENKLNQKLITPIEAVSSKNK